MLERYLVEHCSPTLASIKTANLFNMPYASWKELDGQLKSLKQQFAEKGISLSVVRKREGTALIYVYRRQKLKEDLTKPGVAEFLQTYGYAFCGHTAGYIGKIGIVGVGGGIYGRPFP